MKTVSQPIYCNASDGSQVRNGTHRTMISPFERCWPVPNHEPLTNVSDRLTSFETLPLLWKARIFSLPIIERGVRVLCLNSKWRIEHEI
jgi:hypothetical protein